MSESLRDILLRRSNNEPPEIAAVKEFVERRLNASVAVSVNKTQIIINAKSSALAGALRMHIFELQSTVKSKKKLVIRVG